MKNDPKVRIRIMHMVRLLAYSIDDLAKQTSICRNVIYTALNNGELVGRKCGNRTIILRPDAIKWLLSLPMYKTGECEKIALQA